MPWFGFYSEKQRKLYGYAEYINIEGNKVLITQVSNDIKYRHPYADSIKLGHVIYFCTLKQITCVSYLAPLAKEYLLPHNLILQHNSPLNPDLLPSKCHMPGKPNTHMQTIPLVSTNCLVNETCCNYKKILN
jgi:hypothetical protein